jgi:superfamily II DNA helicase RecQ
MAEACGVIENISELPSIDTDCETFKVVSNETVLTVKVSSSFEAAVKMAFVLLESGKLDEGDAIVIVSSNNGNAFKFKVTKAESTPIAVELVQKVLQFPDEDDTETEIGIDTFANTKTSTQEMQISGSDLIESTLKNYFGHTSFLPLQRETIVSTMAGESVLTVAGTGGGKSLMYRRR